MPVLQKFVSNNFDKKVITIHRIRMITIFEMASQRFENMENQDFQGKETDGISPQTKSLRQKFMEKTSTENISGKLGEKQREELKKNHRKQYLSDYWDKYKKSNKRVKATFTEQEYQRVLKAAQKKGKKVSVYMKETVLQEVDNVYFLPENQNVQDLILQLRGIGNNINQLTRHTHENGVVTPNDIQSLQASLNKIEGYMIEKLSRPN